MNRDVAVLAHSVTGVALRAELDTAERCAMSGCTKCALAAQECRAALALQEFERITGTQLMESNWQVQL